MMKTKKYHFLLKDRSVSTGIAVLFMKGGKEA
jgi:hypothetical protein